ncbi:MAG: glutamate mutase L [Aerococcus sp.]|nr:glutamate mutase L [Aerococcus sp.]
MDQPSITQTAGRRLVFLGDFGSTFSKFQLIELEPTTRIGHVTLETTQKSSIMDCYQQAKMKLLEDTKYDPEVDQLEEYFSSSAWGGFKMVVIGLTEHLTQQAASFAALGSGTRIIGRYAYHLTSADLAEIQTRHPDAILLTGGTDGGNQAFVVEVAKQMSDSLHDIAIIYAGNNQATPEIERILQDSDCPLYLCENVMPKVNVIQIDSVKQTAAAIFIQKIVASNGLEEVAKYTTRPIVPTPIAVQQAVHLIGEVEGAGVLAIDVGGATTDIHSFGSGVSQQLNVLYEGLPEPLLKRTVEGDLGMRESAMSVLKQYSLPQLIAETRMTERELVQRIEKRTTHHDYLPKTPLERQLDEALALKAVDIALDRHLGTITKRDNQTWIQRGKSARSFQTVIATGGVLIHQVSPAHLSRIITLDTSAHTRPENPALYIDTDYILSTAGILAPIYPVAARALLIAHLQCVIPDS